MSPDQKLSFLKDEYLKLQDQYEDFDRRSLQIKGWISAGSVAALAIGLDPEKSAQGALWIIVIAFSLCFWYLEARWKTFQYALSDRIRILEAHFRGDSDLLVTDIHPFQIYNWWFRSYRYDEPIYAYEKAFRPKKYWKRFFEAFTLQFVMFPYVMIILIALIGLAATLLFG